MSGRPTSTGELGMWVDEAFLKFLQHLEIERIAADPNLALAHWRGELPRALGGSGVAGAPPSIQLDRIRLSHFADVLRLCVRGETEGSSISSSW